MGIYEGFFKRQYNILPSCCVLILGTFFWLIGIWSLSADKSHSFYVRVGFKVSTCKVQNNYDYYLMKL